MESKCVIEISAHRSEPNVIKCVRRWYHTGGSHVSVQINTDKDARCKVSQ